MYRRTLPVKRKVPDNNQFQIVDGRKNPNSGGALKHFDLDQVYLSQSLENC